MRIKQQGSNNEVVITLTKTEYEGLVRFLEYTSTDINLAYFAGKLQRFSEGMND